MIKITKKMNLQGLIDILRSVQKYQLTANDKYYTLQDLITLVKQDCAFWVDMGWFVSNQPRPYEIKDFCKKYNLKCDDSYDEMQDKYYDIIKIENSSKKQ